MGILGIVLTVVMAAAVIFYWEFIQGLGAYGYLGAFIISLFGGATVIAPIPMTPVIFALGRILTPWFVGVAAGLGETLGGLAIYMTGYGGGTAFVKSKHGKIQAIYSRLAGWMERRGSLTLFILSATVNPFFYPAGLAAGALRFGVWKYTLICLVGKIIKGWTVAFAGYWGLRELMRILGMPV